MLKKIYLHRNGVFRLWVPRAGSSSLSHMQLMQELPDVAKAHNYPDPKGAFRQPEVLLPVNWTPNVPKGAAVMVRDPIDRFISGAQMTGGKNIDVLLDMISNPDLIPSSNKNLLYHLLPVSMISTPDCKFFKFPDKLADCAKYLGMPGPIPNLKLPLAADKPVLTDAQMARVKVVFADDIKLFESL